MESSSPATSQTSAQAFAAVGLKTLKHEQDRVHDICLSAQRNGYADLSGREIQVRYELQYGKRIDAGSVSARISALIAAGRLERLPDVRVCSVTGRDVHPVRVPISQARLVG